MLSTVFRKAFQVLMKKPIRLWGISLMNTLLVFLACLFGLVPLIWIPIVITLSAGMQMVYLDGYRGKDVDCNQLFKGFSNFKKVCGGMGWMMLWTLIWGLIPIVGFVFACIKNYAYCFTPYILMSDDEVSAVDAIKVSSEQTRGYKGKIFLADLIVYGAIFVVTFVLGLLSAIPYIGILFGLILFLFGIVAGALCPLFCGLIRAAFYVEITENPTPAPAYAAPSAFAFANVGAPAQPAAPAADAAPKAAAAPQRPAQPGIRICPSCGAPVNAGNFCPSCGRPLR